MIFRTVASALAAPRRAPSRLRLAARRLSAADRLNLSATDGFTIVESLVAAVVLVIALLGAFTFLDSATITSRATLAREGATTLAREITEDAREMPFSQLSNNTIVQQLQNYPGLGNSGTGSTWQIQRRGITYTITASVCAVDSPKDGYGVHSSNINWCSDSSSTGTADPQPVDFQRVNVDVQYQALGSTHDIHEVATISSTGQAVGLATSSLALSSPALPDVGNVNGTTTQPQVVSTSVTQLAFSVTAPAGTTTIIWTVNGVQQGWSSTNTSGTTWTSSAWTISGLSDGTYVVGAAAENSSGVIGPAVTIPVQLVRSIPAAPNVTSWGYNANLYEPPPASPSGPYTVAEIQWQKNSELNVTGYRIYNPSGTLICTTTNALVNSSCGASAWCSNATSCIDLNPPAPTSSNLTYQVVATYYDKNGVLQQSPATSVTMTGTPFKTFNLAPTTGNTGTNCSANNTTLKDMLGTYTPSGTDSTQLAGQIMFCSDAFSAGQVIEAGGTATAYFTNKQPTTCQITGTLGLDGTQVLSSSVTLPGSLTTVTKETFNFTLNSQYTMNAGDRITLAFGMNNNNSGCTQGAQGPTIYYGSTGHPGQLSTTPLPVSAPGAPTSLTLTTNADGSITLTWKAPTSGTPVNFYRIYRGGTNYTNRYQIATPADCTSGTCTWSDGVRPSPPYNYYVTSVGGTTNGASMAESASTGPVNG